jgi:hypothetical protein
MSVFAAKAALARAAGAASRLTGRGATSLPGTVLLALDSTAIERLASGLPRGSVVISATNGKTTTAALCGSIPPAMFAPAGSPRRCWRPDVAAEHLPSSAFSRLTSSGLPA